MAGIYVHIPFCGYACSYCDFYFTTHLNFKNDFLKALYTEIDLRKSFLENQTIDTIYFGGGTPSKLTAIEITSIINKLKASFNVNPKAEITLEANPDDINIKTANEYRDAGLNRLSMGIQSFHNNELNLLGRKHSSQKAIEAVEAIRVAGFNNFNLDLIYGVPDSSIDSWRENLKQIIALNPNHISSYCLTIEEGTKLDYQVKKGRVTLPSEDIVIEQFKLLIQELNNAGYEHYEISNFAKPGKLSEHNTAYWSGAQYLGLGPSAHSFDGINRYLNIANSPKYIEKINERQPAVEEEVLSLNNRFNEFVMTRLRTHWGISKLQIQEFFNDGHATHISKEAQRYILTEDLVESSNSIKLTEKGKLIADKIASDLFIV
ncbi:MAG: radical SAM family heme chaperone HemW [Salibacteraceae bacterium]